eukprot:Amastigsp_a2642_3.p5 type:complete len:111 gc:universal Amastigsp_a2642_3:629-297(-)
MSLSSSRSATSTGGAGAWHAPSMPRALSRRSMCSSSQRATAVSPRVGPSSLGLQPRTTSSSSPPATCSSSSRRQTSIGGAATASVRSKTCSNAPTSATAQCSCHGSLQSK